MSEDIAGRVRRIRELGGLSQRELAKRSGVSNAMISLIERGKTNPSFGMLKRILDAIPISMSDFFAIDIARDVRFFFSHDELLEIGNGPVSYLEVGSQLGDRRLQMLYETYAPGADTGQSSLSHEGEEAGVVVQGVLEVTVHDQVRLLRSGDAYQFSSMHPHRFRNPGREPCIVVSACTPPTV